MSTQRLSFREARETYNKSHPKTSYAEAAKSAPKSVTNSEQMTLTQFIALLRSFGLTCVRTSEVSERSSVPAVPTTAEVTEDAGTDGDGFTLVQRRRVTKRQPSTPAEWPSTETPAPSPGLAQSGRPPISETAVMAALRRNEEEKRARDARRARLVEKVREGRVSPVVGTLAAGGGASSAPPREASPSAHPEGSLPPMAPPPPPPPPPRLRGPLPPPLPAGPTDGELPDATPPSTPVPLEPPPAPGRPSKRVMPRDGSPTERGTPRTRHKAQGSPGGGRASSADGRLGRGSLHPRVQFGGTGTTPGAGGRS